MNILITGASGAIGKEIARKLALKGHSLLLACRSEEKGCRLADEMNDKGAVTAKFIQLDLSDSISVRSAAAKISNNCIDGIINNAGTMNSIYRTSADKHEDTLNVNYHNTKLLTELLIPSIRQGGAIVFTTSATRSWYPLQKRKEDISENEFSRLKTYALSKKLITTYARDLSARLKSNGIRVNCSDPGVVDSPMLRMGKWYDCLTDTIFRPLCFSPATGADAAVRAFFSDHTGRIYTAPFGSISIPRKLFFR